MTPTERFWFGVASVAGAADSPPLVQGARDMAVDVLWDSDAGDAFAVLVSEMEDATQGTLKCLCAFTNIVAWADALRQQGIKAIETPIAAEDRGTGTFDLTITAPLKLATNDEEAGDPAPVLGTLHGVRFTPAAGDAADPEPLTVVYGQDVSTPAAGVSNSEVIVRSVEVEMPRQDVCVLQDGASFVFSGKGRMLLPPRLADLPYAFAHSRCGQLVRRLSDILAPPAAPPLSRPVLKHRASEFKTTGYRFTDVELIGMRIDLRPFGDAADDLLARMIRPLNFHLDRNAKIDPISAMGFSYRPAARVLVLELVRYGRMYLGYDKPDQGQDDPFESQYELLLRVLVGRVDDDGAQARDPAMFVPAVFVDSAWSKMIGREYQGFRKRLARFVDSSGHPLRPAGGPRNGSTSPLFDVARVEQVDSFRSNPRITPILDIDLPSIDPDWFERAEPVDSFGVSLAAGPRWRQSDFSRKEFRRSFAREVLQDGPTSFNSMQVAPVDRRGLPPAWITGSFHLNGLRAAFPPGIATLQLGDSAELPYAFRLLRKVMRNEPIAMPTGDWYVGRCSLDLRVEDGLV
ncbi:hypothetical protein [Variovorax gracilis]|uniref:hypothetical protein n=1 Tax=Variovorax gracilis TaxID=3053502 RepID=UPI002578D07E|nr:hypothetical protein [Variovorax sp. J22R24]